MVIQDTHLDSWEQGQIDFHDLLSLYSPVTHIELAVELGIPMPRRLVSVRHALYGWPVEDETRIILARRQYDNGEVELATGRVGSYFTLYSFPRVHRWTGRKYFF
jgi:hypothetical protein